MDSYKSIPTYPDFGDVSTDLDHVTNHLFVLDVFEVDVVKIDILARHPLIGQEEHRVSASHTADAAVKVR